MELAIFNAKGQKVKTLIDRNYASGSYSATWNGDDANGSQVASGLYFYRLTADGKMKSGKLMLLK